MLNRRQCSHVFLLIYFYPLGILCIRNFRNLDYNLIAESTSMPYLTAHEFARAANMTEKDFAHENMVGNPLKDPETKHLYFEGDMMGERKKYEDIMFVPEMWPNGRIPYVIEAHFTRQERDAIALGILILHEHTCVRFVPRERSDKDFVHIIKDRGCAAHVGKHGGEQFIILGRGCFGVSTVVHELMHALGFIHEQSRPDRDQYVQIFWENIRPDRRIEFRRHKEDYFHKNGFPYDVYSVMHYREFAFSKNGKETIVAKEPGVDLRCRWFECPTRMDIEKIRHFYECDSAGHREGHRYGDRHRGDKHKDRGAHSGRERKNKNNNNKNKKNNNRKVIEHINHINHINHNNHNNHKNHNNHINHNNQNNFDKHNNQINEHHNHNNNINVGDNLRVKPKEKSKSRKSKSKSDGLDGQLALNAFEYSLSISHINNKDHNL